MNCRSMGVGIFKRAGHKRHTRDTVGLRPSFLGFLPVSRPTSELRRRRTPLASCAASCPTRKTQGAPALLELAVGLRVSSSFLVFLRLSGSSCDEIHGGTAQLPFFGGTCGGDPVPLWSPIHAKLGGGKRTMPTLNGIATACYGRQAAHLPLSTFHPSPRRHRHMPRD